MKKRVKLLVRNLAVALFFCLLYAYIGARFGLFVPCVFRVIMGLKCPGCGVTHMCLDLLHFHFGEAFMENQALFLMLPVLCVIVVRKMIQYIRTAHVELSHAERMVCLTCIVLLILFGIGRNVVDLMYKLR